MKYLKSLTIGLLLLTLVVGCNIRTGRPTGTPVPSIPAAVRTPTPEPTEETGETPEATDETGGVSTWEILNQIEVAAETTVVGFFNETFGLRITAAAPADMLITTDGGANWVSTDEHPATPYGFDIVNENLVWAIGNAGQVRVLTGGQTWQAVTNLPYTGKCMFISFVDDQVGWAASSSAGKLWATADGGQTWTEVALPEDSGEIATVALRTASDGYLLDSSGTLYVTADGGQSWSAQSMGLENNVLTTTNIPLAAMRFTDADNGVVIATLVGGQGAFLALRTADGGQTWEQEVLPVDFGSPYLTHDGTLLTFASTTGQATLLRSQ